MPMARTRSVVLRYFTLTSIAGGIAAPTVIGPDWSPGVKALAWLLSVVGAPAVCTIVWVRIVRPLLDRYVVGAVQREQPAVEKWLREAVLAADLEEIGDARSTAAGALAIAQSTATTLEQSLDLTRQSTELATAALGRLEGAVKNYGEEVSALRREFDAQRRGSLPSTYTPKSDR